MNLGDVPGFMRLLRLKKFRRSHPIESRVAGMRRPVRRCLARIVHRGRDALVLASSREGWANVMLESMACGTLVVVTRVRGIPKVVAAPVAGVLMDGRSAAAIAAGVARLLANPPRPGVTLRAAVGAAPVWGKK